MFPGLTPLSFKAIFQMLTKLLNQDERKFILTAMKVAETETFSSTLGDVKDSLKKTQSDKAANALMSRIEKKAKSRESPKHSSFLASFFKGFANVFLGRVSSNRVFTAISKIPMDEKYF